MAAAAVVRPRVGGQDNSRGRPFGVAEVSPPRLRAGSPGSPES
ncbi:hypothetical protein EBESD8_57840 [Rhodococcus aetherivorans]|nr:hypothetical protein EBESD8_57840 [Rhodococcus aetherivorans]